MLTTTRSSHVRVYEECPRKWFLAHQANYVMDSDAMAWGREFHLHLEHWYKHGTPPPNTPTGRAARFSLRHLPPPGSLTLRAELAWAVEAQPGLQYTGAIDLCDTATMGARECTYVQMWDHKSCADVRWAKSVAELTDDISANAYAKYLCDTYKVDEVRCRWVYTQRDGKQSVPVDFVITSVQADARWARTMAAVDAMQAILALQPPPATLHVTGPRTIDTCYAYRGCPHLTTCGIVRTKKEHENMAGSKLLEQLSKLGTPLINPPDAAPHNTPAPVDPAAGGLLSAAEQVVVAGSTAALAKFTTKQLLLELLRRG